jgi:hypothetical protein
MTLLWIGSTMSGHAPGILPSLVRRSFAKLRRGASSNDREALPPPLICTLSAANVLNAGGHKKVSTPLAFFEGRDVG